MTEFTYARSSGTTRRSMHGRRWRRWLRNGAELAVAVLRGKLYAVGGFGGPEDEDLSLVERYDPATNTWEAVAPMSIARDGHGMAVFGGKLYAVGGEDKTGAVLDSVEGYDPTANMWQRMTPLHRPRKGHGVACG